MFGKPKTAKRLYFDVIPKAVDEYHQQLRAYPDQDWAQKLANPVHHIHNGTVPASDMVVSFAMLLNLASVAGAEDKETLWGFIRRYAPDASPETNPDMDQAAGFAVRYYNDFVKPEKTFRLPNDAERAALEDLVARLKVYDGPIEDEALQTLVFAVGKDHGFEPLRDWFRALYEVLMGASQGPRFGGFIALYGVNETIALIEAGLSGDLAA
jgi:lysyl-tRNA synthetase class 1